MLTITESGFERIPLARRAKAFAANEGGWGMVVELIGSDVVVHAGGVKPAIKCLGDQPHPPASAGPYYQPEDAD